MNQSSNTRPVRLQAFFSSVSQNRIAQQTAIALTILLFTVLFVQGYGKTFREEGNDFTSYLRASTMLLQGENIYQSQLYYPALYPLFLPLVVSPLLYIPKTLAYCLWYGCSVAALLVSIKLLFSNEMQQPKTTLAVPLFLVLLAYIPIIQNNMLNGQVNCFVLLFSLLFLKYYGERHSLLAAVFLGMAISLKLVPVLFFLFLLLRKQWRLVMAASAFAIGVCLIPTVFLGEEIFGAYYDLFVLKVAPWLFDATIEHTIERHFSLYGFLATHWPVLFGFVWVKWLSMVFIGMILLMVECLQERNINLWWTVSLYWLAILLISPISETHHLLYSLPALALLVHRGIFVRWNLAPWVWFGIFGFLIVYYIGHFTRSSAFLFGAIVILFGVNICMLLSQGIQDE